MQDIMTANVIFASKWDSPEADTNPPPAMMVNYLNGEVLYNWFSLCVCMNVAN